MPDQDIIVIGGSAGALEGLTTLLKGLPSSLPACLFVVIHTSSDSSGMLPQILERNGNLQALFPGSPEPLEYGRVYVAPPDHHMMITAGGVSAVTGPRENGFRPAIDPLFRSAAEHYRERVVGIILSGALDDGTFGLMAVKEAGGKAIVQHPYESLLPSMPLSAIQSVEVDHIVRASEIAPLLTAAAASTAQNGSHRPAPAPGRPDRTDRDVTLTSVNPDLLQGPPSIFSCPECGGILWEIGEGGSFRFRCHTGHGFAPEALLSRQDSTLEYALWSAVRALKERAALHRQMSERVSERGMMSAAKKYGERSQEEDAKAAIIRQLILNTQATGTSARPAATAMRASEPPPADDEEE
ncbi:MAG: chemotaxis protein CheB [Pirellulaceae bacterium]